MKLIIALNIALAFTVTTSFAYTPLDLKPGLWRYETDASNLIESALSNVPESQRAMVKAMMEKMGKDKMPGTIVYACQSEEVLKNPEKMFKQQAQNNKDMQDCDFKITESSKKKAVFKLTCKNGVNANVRMIVENEKKHSSFAKMRMPQMNNKETEIKTSGSWVGPDCSNVEKLNKEATKIPGGFSIPGM
jgi:hypothetical protein